MLEEVGFTISYAPVASILYLHITIEIASAEGIIIFVLEISNDIHNTIISNPPERVYLSLPYLYLD